MIDSISGKITRKNPAFIVVNCNGIGYSINISLNTFEKIKNLEEVDILTYLSVKEDSHTLFGFAEENERTLFKHLISVSGIGPNSGRMILSSLSTNDIFHAIINNNISLLKSIKGIGPKSAQRMVLELQDKLKKEDWSEISTFTPHSIFDEALAALLALGFNRGNAEKALQKIMTESQHNLNVEELIKKSLKIL